MWLCALSVVLSLTIIIFRTGPDTIFIKSQIFFNENYLCRP